MTRKTRPLLNNFGPFFKILLFLVMQQVATTRGLHVETTSCLPEGNIISQVNAFLLLIIQIFLKYFW